MPGAFYKLSLLAIDLIYPYQFYAPSEDMGFEYFASGQLPILNEQFQRMENRETAIHLS
jgi:hypothetical protein